MTRLNTTQESPIYFDIVIPSLVAANRKQATRLIAHEIAKLIGVKEHLFAERLIENEKENPSAMGDGVSVAHLHVSGLQNPINAFIRLKNAIPMDAPDNMDVDLICLLLTPEREGSAYLRTLARTSRLLRNGQFCLKLRAAQNEKAIRTLLDQTSVQVLAA